MHADTLMHSPSHTHMMPRMHTYIHTYTHYTHKATYCPLKTHAYYCREKKEQPNNREGKKPRPEEQSLHTVIGCFLATRTSYRKVQIEYSSSGWLTFLDSKTQTLVPSSSTLFHHRRPTSRRPVTFFTVQKSTESNRMVVRNISMKCPLKMIGRRIYTRRADVRKKT